MRKITLVMLLFPLLHFAQVAGNFDITFGNGGKVMTDFNNVENQGYGAAIQPDGKILVVGRHKTLIYSDFCILRYNPDGTLDQTFGNSGMITYDIDTRNDYAAGLALLEDGKIVVGGYSERSNFSQLPYHQGAIIRLNNDGTLDTTFGNQGKVKVPLSTTAGFKAFNFKMQPDGKLLLAGSLGPSPCIWRGNADGTTDTTFSGNGYDTFISSAWVQGIDIRPDGKIILVGANSGLTELIGFIACYNPNGTLDTSFGSNGVRTFSGTGFYSVKILPDGTFLAAGTQPQGFLTLIKLNPDGTTFLPFGPNGYADAQSLIGDGAWKAIEVQPDGKIIVTGSYYDGLITTRYTPDGFLDSSFGISGTGYTETKMTTGPFTYNNSMNTIVLQPDGKILTVGFANTSNTAPNDIAMIRYTGECIGPSPAPTGSTTQEVCYNATLSALSVQGVNVKWYKTATGFEQYTVPSLTQLTQGTTYYASQTSGYCESTERLAVQVTIAAPIAAPQASNQVFCSGAKVMNLVATGENIKWYSSFAGGTLLSENTSLSNGTAYWASQTINGCESPERKGVLVNINPTPALPFANDQVFCGPAKVSQLSAIATNPQWYASPSATTALAPTYDLATGFYYVSDKVNSCESQRKQVYVAVVCEDISVTLNNGVLTAGQNGSVFYQWIKCPSAIIPGATQRSYTPTESGQYAVRLTNGSCVRTSECVAVTVLSVDDKPVERIRLFPNPVSDSPLNLEGVERGSDYRIINVLGQEVSKGKVNNNSIQVFQLSAGMYTLLIQYNENRELLKFIKK